MKTKSARRLGSLRAVIAVTHALQVFQVAGYGTV